MSLKVSKKMSYLLRHNPAAGGLTLSESGWASTRELARALNVTEENVLEIVENDTKKRYEVSGGQIRAAQGHSINVNLGLTAKTPPTILYHGTIEEAINPIRELGLLPRSRQYVHLSADKETAEIVGARRGEPIILTVNAEKMEKEGFTFYQAANGVWLTLEVPARFIN